MINVNWLFLCFEMMCDYFPNSYVVREDKRKFLELSEHFCALENLIEHRLSVESKVFFNRKIGLGYTRNEMHESALPYYKKAFGFLSNDNDESVPFEDIIKTYFCMAECYMQLDDYENAIRYSDLLIEYLTNKTNCKNNYYFIALLYRAKIYRFYGEKYYSLSKENYQKTLELEPFILENYYDDHFVDVIATHVGLATTNFKMGYDDESKKHLHYSCEMIEKRKQDDFPEEYAYVFYDIGILLENFHETDKALQYFNHALKIDESMFYDDAHTIHLTLKKLASIYEKKSNSEMAEYYINRALLYTQRAGGRINGS